MDGSIEYENQDGDRVQEFLQPYSEEERQEAEINKANASLIWRAKSISVDTSLFTKGLTHTEVLIYSFISSFFKEGASGKFYFSNEQLVTLFNVSERTIRNALQGLKAAGLLTTHQRIKAGGGQIRFIDLAENCRTIRQPLPHYTAKNAASYKELEDNSIEDNSIEKRQKVKKQAKPEKIFTPPTLAEVEEFVRGRKRCPISPIGFFEHYELGDWEDKDGKKIKNWKQKLITWERFEFEKHPELRRVNETSDQYFERTTGRKITYSTPRAEELVNPIPQDSAPPPSPTKKPYDPDDIFFA